MNCIIKRVLFFFFLMPYLLFCGSPGALAQNERPQLSVKIEVKKEVKKLENGEWKLKHVPVESTEKGDALVYTLTYTNEGSTGVSNAVIVDPIPQGTIYLPGSATSEHAEILCSIDGGLSFQRPPARYTIKKPDGTTVETEAPPEMYTHIKWIVKKVIQPGESGRLNLKVRVK